MNKAETIDRLTYYLKLYSLALMYAKHLDKVLFYASMVVATANQIKIVIAQPEPKFKKGSAIIGDARKSEMIILPSGQTIKLKHGKL